MLSACQPETQYFGERIVILKVNIQHLIATCMICSLSMILQPHSAVGLARVFGLKQKLFFILVFTYENHGSMSGKQSLH